MFNCILFDLAHEYEHALSKKIILKNKISKLNIIKYISLCVDNSYETNYLYINFLFQSQKVIIFSKTNIQPEPLNSGNIFVSFFKNTIVSQRPCRCVRITWEDFPTLTLQKGSIFRCCCSSGCFHGTISRNASHYRSIIL